MVDSSVHIEISFAYLHIEDEILFITLKEDTDIDVEQVEEAIRCREKIQKGVPMLTLTDVRGLYTITNEARSIAAKNKNLTKLSKARAILTSSLATKMFANFFIKINKPQTPTKMFNNKEKALLWLNGFK